MKHEVPYDKVAKIYDKILDHIDYEDWVYYIFELSELYNVKPNSVMDLACGTGSFLKELPEEIITAVGIEKSKGMAEVARTKLEGKATIIEADITNFAIDKNFDLITCLLDSINYLKGFDQVTKLLDNVYTYLKPGGLFIFDAVSQRACKEHFFNFTEKSNLDDIDYERYCHYDVFENIQYSEFTITIEGESYYEKHAQYIYSFSDIIDRVKKSNFELLNVFSDFELKPLEKNTERAHFVLRKNA